MCTVQCPKPSLLPTSVRSGLRRRLKSLSAVLHGPRTTVEYLHRTRTRPRFQSIETGLRHHWRLWNWYFRATGLSYETVGVTR